VEIRPVSDGDLAAVAKIALANDEHEATDPRYVRHQAAHGRFLVAADGTGPDGTGPDGTGPDGTRPDETRPDETGADEALNSGVAGYGAVRRIGGATMLCDLFVDPERHGAGTGKLLLGALLAGAGERFTFASKDPRAMPLYARHGMAPRWPLLYLSGLPGAGAARAGATGGRATGGRARAEEVSAAEAAAEELRLTGHDRAADYAFWAGTPSGAAVVVRDAGITIAAGTIRAGLGTAATTAAATAQVCHLATAPGRDPVAALAAVLAFLSPRLSPRPTPRLAPRAALVRLCLPGPHPALGALLDAGWRIDDYDHHMSSRPDLLSPSLVPSPSLS
jgi:GNAT superfamily N-acetyltransferase